MKPNWNRFDVNDRTTWPKACGEYLVRYIDDSGDYYHKYNVVATFYYTDTYCLFIRDNWPVFNIIAYAELDFEPTDFTD